MCVTTRNSGPSSSYNAVARELAESTNFEYPDTPEEVAQYRRHFNDKMMVRVRRREARDAEQRHRMRSHSRCCDANGKCSGNKIPAVSHNTATGKTASTGHVADVELDQVPSNSNADVTLRKKARQNQPKKDSKQPGGHDGNANNTHTRSWMFMAPDEWGFCTKSNQPKPPRSHYDHVSKSLVMCLDHYCPWMFNAIGYFNYRYFLNFLIYVCVAMLYGAFISYRPFINSTGSVYRDQLLRYRKTGVWMYIHPYTPMPSERGPLTLGFMLCLAVGIAVACLGSFHVYLTLSGQTTIEFHGNFINRAKAKRRGEKYRNPYDMGWKRNWQQIYGDYGNTLSMVMAMVIPSRREPHFLPLPLGGEAGKRKHLRARDQDDGDEMTKPILGSTSNLSDAGNIV
ncbi:unnamed protein product [Pseudo-nitzschia multistriata]|uniref:Palmitoyltransferase n=1 Tax=Pseudo-nitzschia multistriata TaxID=183589 RepID=A0A448Z4G6_9STRA|nr:unnamed protein product [Pseudo-nitzschia multistriata]